MEQNKLHLEVWAVVAGLVAALIIGFIVYWYHPGRQMKIAIPFVLYENSVYTPYTLTKEFVERAPRATSSTPLVYSYPGGRTLTVTEKGLLLTVEGGQQHVLIERADLTPDAWSISHDGAYAVLFNQTTESYDVFEVLYQGATVTYVGSFARPALPTYTVAVGFAGEHKIVLRTGAPEEFRVYKIKNGAIQEAFVATLKQAGNK